jgi:hypothetical protein
MVERDQIGGSSSTVVGHCKKDNCSVYIGRGYNSEHINSNVPIDSRGWLGNPYRVGRHGSREEVVEKFMNDFIQKLNSNAEFRRAVAELEGETLGCWCQRAHEDDGDLCHGEVIKRAVEKLNE